MKARFVELWQAKEALPVGRVLPPPAARLTPISRERPLWRAQLFQASGATTTQFHFRGSPDHLEQFGDAKAARTPAEEYGGVPVN